MDETKHYTVEELVALCLLHKVRRVKSGPNEVEMDASAFAPVVQPGEEKESEGPKDDMDFLAMGISPDMQDGLKGLLDAIRTGADGEAGKQ